MKKIFSIFVLLVFISILSGCNLAVKDEYYDYTENLGTGKNTEDYYIPSGVEFSLYNGFGLETEIDVSEYFYVSFNCPNESIFENSLTLKIVLQNTKGEHNSIAAEIWYQIQILC